jgi:hypothetical protein
MVILGAQVFVDVHCVEIYCNEYTLKTLAVPDSDAQSPFQYSIFPVSLTEVRKPIPKDYYYYSQQQKQLLLEYPFYLMK